MDNTNGIRIVNQTSECDPNSGVERIEYELFVDPKADVDLPDGSSAEGWIKDVVEEQLNHRPEGHLSYYDVVLNREQLFTAGGREPFQSMPTGATEVTVEFEQPMTVDSYPDAEPDPNEVTSDSLEEAIDGIEVPDLGEPHPAQAAGSGSSTDGPTCPVDGCSDTVEGELYDHMMGEHGWYDPSMEEQI